MLNPFAGLLGVVDLAADLLGVALRVGWEAAKGASLASSAAVEEADPEAEGCELDASEAIRAAAFETDDELGTEGVGWTGAVVGSKRALSPSMRHSKTI